MWIKLAIAAPFVGAAVLVGVASAQIAPPVVTTIPINLSAETVKQFETWISEPGGLTDDLRNPAFTRNPENLIARVDLGGMTLVQYENGQVSLFQTMLLNNGLSVLPDAFTTDMRGALALVADSYNGVYESPVTLDDGSTIMRRSLQVTLNTLRTDLGMPYTETPVRAETAPKLSGEISHTNTMWAIPTANCASSNINFGAGSNDGNAWNDLDDGFGAGRGSGAVDDATTYYKSIDGPTNATLDLTSAGIYAQHPAGKGFINWGVLSMRHAKSASSGQQIDITVSFGFSGGACNSNPTAESVSATNITNTWTTTQNGFNASTLVVGGVTISNWSNAFLQTLCNKVGGGSARACWISAVELQVPDVSDVGS